MEIEYKLTVLDPAVLADLAARRELVGFNLRPAGRRAIWDRFWDTPGADLAAHQVNLRLRVQDGQPRFTVKGASVVSDGLFVRPELEVPADPAGLEQVLAELRSTGLALDPPRAATGDPAGWLQTLGLELTQDRRTTRDAVEATVGPTPRAEITLDTTAYQVGPYEIIFREIEIEALTDDPADVRTLGAALAMHYAGRVRPSELGKYTRGLDLAARLA